MVTPPPSTPHPRVGRSKQGLPQPPPSARSQRIFIKSLQNRIQNSGINNGYKGKLQSSCISSPGTYSKVLVGCRVFCFFLSFLFNSLFLPPSPPCCFLSPSPKRRQRGATLSPALAVFIHRKAEQIPPTSIKNKTNKRKVNFTVQVSTQSYVR